MTLRDFKICWCDFYYSQGRISFPICQNEIGATDLSYQCWQMRSGRLLKCTEVCGLKSLPLTKVFFPILIFHNSLRRWYAKPNAVSPSIAPRVFSGNCLHLKCARHVLVCSVSFRKLNLEVVVLISFGSTSQAGWGICYGYMVVIIEHDVTCKYYNLQDLVVNPLNIKPIV